MEFIKNQNYFMSYQNIFMNYSIGELKMEDFEIVDLYWERDERAIKESDAKFHRYLFKIAYNVLSNKEDSMETLNDTYMKAWFSMPPHRPCRLSLYLGKIVRELSIDSYRKMNRIKRKSNQYCVSISELDNCIPDTRRTEEIIDLHILVDCINTFLASLSSEKRSIFVCRYYYMDSIDDIAKHFGFTKSKVKNILFKLRKELKIILEKDGYDL